MTRPTEPGPPGERDPVPPPDRILIRDLLLRGILGLNEWEREKRQDILLNIELHLDARAAGRSDEVGETIDYRAFAKDVIAYVEGSSHRLVEALATAVARIAVVEHGAARAIVRVEKPGALRFARSVGVQIERVRADFG